MENYLYAGARIRTLENATVGADRLERLLSCSSIADCVLRLEEWGVSVLRTPDGAFDREATLEKRLSDAYAEVLSSPEDADFARIWLLPYDCCNIKSAIKCRKRGISCERMLIPVYGGIPTDTVRHAIEKHDYASLPASFATAAREAAEELAQTSDPRCVDRILDAACYAEMLRLAQKSGVSLAKRLVEKRIDLTNIMLALRACKMGGACAMQTMDAFFLPGGEITKKDLAEWMQAGADELIERLYYTPCEQFSKLAQATDRSLAQLERVADDVLMELAREAKTIPFGAEVLIGFLIGREYEVKNLRILLAGKSVGLDAGALKERMRLNYV